MASLSSTYWALENFFIRCQCCYPSTATKLAIYFKNPKTVNTYFLKAIDDAYTVSFSEEKNDT